MWILLVFGWQLTLGQSGQTSSPAATSGLQLYVFLSPECPLCQNYTRTLNQLEHQYAGKISIHGIIPGKTVKQTEITAFTNKYHIAYPLQPDRDLRIVRAMHATTTPEAILLGPDNSVIYQGAIDNWYKTLGRAANKPTQNYLQDAIDYSLRHQSPPVKKTAPVGCLINDF
jgi:thiol-disulfide isomerase/thioredoxin